MADFIASVALKLHDQFSAPALKAKAAWANLETGAQKAQFAGAKMVDVGKKATMAVTVPIVAAGTAAIKAGVDFNKGLANVASLGVAEDRVRALGKDVQGMAVQFGQSTSSLNEGLYNVISAFGDTAETSRLLQINTQAAAAGMATTSEAIALTSAVTKGYGDTSAAAMQKAADLAFQTVKLGQTTFPELAASIGKVTGNANALGVSQEDLFAVFATSTGVVGSAAEVSTSTAAILNEMIKPTKALSGAIDALGYSSTDAMIQQLGFGGAIQALGGYAHDSDVKISSLFGSSEAGRVAMTIAGSQADVFNSKLKEMYNSSGALDAAYAAQTGGINELGFQFEQLKSQAAVSAQNIGQSLMPALRLTLQIVEPLASGIGSVATWFGNLPQPLQNSALAIAGIAVAAGPVSVVTGSLVSSVGKLGAGYVRLNRFAHDHSTQLKTLSGYFVRAGSGVLSLSRQFVLAIPKAYAFAVANWAVIGPMIAITVGIAAVIAIGVLLIKHWDTVKAFGARVWNGIVYGVQTAIVWLGNLLNNPFFAAVGVLFAPWITIPALVVKIIMAHWEPIKAFFAAVWDGITLGARAAWAFVVGVFSPVGNAVVAAWQPAKAFFIGMWDAVLFTLHSVGAFFNGVFTAIAGRLIAVWQPAKAFFVGMWDAVLLVLRSVGGFFSGTFAAIAQGIITAWQPVKAFFVSLFGPINKVVSSASSAWKWLVGGNTEGAGGGQTVPDNVKKFGAGGYTGPGGASQVAGVVHAGEYVFSQAAVDTIGLGNLDYLHKHPGPIQFAQGIGAAEGPAPSGGGNGNISIHIENLTVNADEIEEIGDFVRLLMRAGGAA